MKILFISAFPPNQKTAGQDYSRRLILDLLSKGIKVSLIYASYPKHEVELPKEVEILRVIKPSLQNCFKMLSIHPFFTRRFNKTALEYIQGISNLYDILYFDFSQVHIYSNYINHPYKVLMCHDVIYQKYSRKNICQRPFIKESEEKLLKTAKKIITFSNKDCQIIDRIYKLNSVSVNFYLKNKNTNFDNVEVNNNTFCFYGAWNRKENSYALAWFLKNVLPYLNQKYSYNIIGGGLSLELRKKIQSYRNIRYLGFVENPIDEIIKCQALIAPLKKGAGVKVKVIDALSCGTSVVGTKIAFEGISDNNKNKLFNLVNCRKDFIECLNNWNNINIDNKKQAGKEFIARYDKNHFPELLTNYLLKENNNTIC